MNTISQTTPSDTITNELEPQIISSSRPPAIGRRNPHSLENQTSMDPVAVPIVSYVKPLGRRSSVRISSQPSNIPHSTSPIPSPELPLPPLAPAFTSPVLPTTSSMVPTSTLPSAGRRNSVGRVAHVSNRANEDVNGGMNTTENASDLMTVSRSEFSRMKSELAGMNRVCQKMCDSIQLWQDKAEALERELNKVKVTCEVQIATSGTPGSKSSHGKQLAAMDIRTSSKVRTQLTEELAGKDVPAALVKHFVDLLDSITSVAHIYISEQCWSDWEKLRSEIDWAPNESLERRELVRDWRGRCLKKTLQHEIVVSGYDDVRVKSIGAPIVHIVSDDNTGNLTISSAFFPLCPLHEARSGQYYTSTPETAANFIGQSMLSMLHSTMGSSVTKQVEGFMYTVASESRVLRSRFDAQCRQVLSTRKKHAKDIYFSLLGYNHIVAARKKDSCPQFDLKRQQQMADAYEKLHSTLPDGRRDTAYWRTASFMSICSENSMSSPVELVDVNGVDLLFKNEPARKAFVMFRKSKIEEQNEMSALTIARMDALMTSVVDSFHDHSEISISNDGIHSDNPTDESQQKALLKGGRIPMTVLRRMQVLLPTAVSLLLQTSYDHLRKALSHDTALMKNELSVRAGGSDVERFDNEKRLHTVAFKYPGHSCYYISITPEAFSKFICKWIGGVSDCYLLYSTSLSAPFKCLEQDTCLEGAYESDEEIENNGSQQMETAGVEEEGRLSTIHNTFNKNGYDGSDSDGSDSDEDLH